MRVAQVPSLTESIVVGNLQTFLVDAVVLAPADPAHTAARILRSHRFDQAPVVEGGHPVGYALLRDLEHRRGSVGTATRPVLPNALSSDLLPLESALPSLAANAFLFVLSGNSISGFAVPSDLNRQAGRAYFYLAITALEIALAEHVRANQEIDPLGFLHKGERDSVRKRLAANTRANVEADVVAEMTLHHLFRIVGSDPETREAVGYEDPAAWSGVSEQINELRRRVSHVARPLYARADELAWLIDTSRCATRMAEALEMRRIASL